MNMRFVVFLSFTLIAGCMQQVEQVDCNRIEDRQESSLCFMNQSLRRLDASICDNILDMEMRAQCIDSIAIELLDYNACGIHDRRPFQDRCENKVGEAIKASR